MILVLVAMATAVLAAPIDSPNFTTCNNYDVDGDGDLDTTCWNEGKEDWKTWDKVWLVGL